MRVLKHLFESNRAWANRIKQGDPDFFEKLAVQQSPEYLWIGCADSRVPANQIIGLLPGVISADSPGVGIAIKVSDGDAARMGSGLESTNRVRPAVTLEILRQLGSLSSQQEHTLAPFGPEKSITNHRGTVTGKSYPVFKF